MSLEQNIDSLSYKSLLGKRNLIPKIPNLNGMTTAYLERYESFLGIPWEYASNTSLRDGTPYYRRYTSLNLDLDSMDIEEIDIGMDDPTLGGRLFYRMTHPFYETTYTGRGDFYRWEQSVMMYTHEMLYHNRISSTQRWDRPLLIDSGLEAEEEEVAEGIIVAPPIDEDTSTPKVYEDINIEPFIIDIECNQALGIKLDSDGVFNVEVDGKLYENVPSGKKFSPLLINNIRVIFPNPTNSATSYDPNTERYTFNPGIDNSNRVPNPTPTYLKVDIYGEELARHNYLVGGDIEEAEEVLMHNIDTPKIHRLVPPGVDKDDPNYPREFWNFRNYVPPKINNFSTRQKELVMRVNDGTNNN